MFEKYSDRARRVIFFSLMVAKQRGAAEIGVEDLLEALVIEDQRDSRRLPKETIYDRVANMPDHPPFFSAEAAATIHRGLEPLLPASDAPSPESVEMPLSAAVKDVLLAAYGLSQELRHERAGNVEPLHLLAAVLADETCEVGKIVKEAGVEREAVIAAIRSGEYST